MIRRFKLQIKECIAIPVMYTEIFPNEPGWKKEAGTQEVQSKDGIPCIQEL